MNKIKDYISSEVTHRNKKNNPNANFVFKKLPRSSR